MRKLAAWCHDRRRTVIGLWVAAFFLSAALMATAAGEYINNFNLPGTESQRAYDLLKERFPAQSGDTANVVFAVEEGGVLDAANRPQIERVVAEIEKSPEVLAVGDPFARGAPVSQDGKITFAQIQFRKGAGDVDPAAVKTMAEDTLALDGKGGVQVALGGDVIHWSTAEQGGAGEIIGILVAAFVLFLTLGVVAMGLPLLNALFAMVVSLSLMAVIGTRVLDVVDWTPQLAAMIGIGVGIDYALLILNRFRLERGGGRDVREATLIALDTSGRAVLFAGIVVVIAMLGMMLLGISFLYGPAIGAALAVLFTMVAALTLMPAIMGSRIGRRIKPATNGNGGGGADLADRESGFAARWSAFVARRPLPVAILALAILIALVLPATHMRLATSDASTYKKDDTTRIAYDLLKEGFGPGFNAPLLLAVELPEPGDQAALQQISAALSEQDGIAQVLPPQLNERGDTATMIAYPATTPQDERTDEVVRQARNEILPPIAEQTGARVSIGGTTASNLDFAQTIRDKLPLFIGVVVGLSLLLLAVVFRSLLIPVKAGIFNLLSIGGRVRRRDPDLPGRQPGGPVRRRHRSDRVVPADHGLRRRVRPVDGLRGVPRLTHARGVDEDARRDLRRPPRPGHDRPRGDRGGDHHDRGLRRLRDRQRAGAGHDGRRLRLGDLHRRLHHPAAAAAGGDAPRRSRDVVDAGVAREAPAAPQHRASRRRRGAAAGRRQLPGARAGARVVVGAACVTRPRSA